MVPHDSGNGLFTYPRGRPGRDRLPPEKLPCPESAGNLPYLRTQGSYLGQIMESVNIVTSTSSPASSGKLLGLAHPNMPSSDDLSESD
jgi:hypothetical protein